MTHHDELLDAILDEVQLDNMRILADIADMTLEAFMKEIDSQITIE